MIKPSAALFADDMPLNIRREYGFLVSIGKENNEIEEMLQDAKNAANANLPIYGSAYIKTADGYFFGTTPDYERSEIGQCFCGGSHCVCIYVS